MAVDKSGEWWTGSTAEDVAEYLRAYEAGGYPVDEVVPAACDACFGQAGFMLRLDADEGFVERICQSCSNATLMLDSVDVVDDATPVALRCPCGAREFDVAVGFSRRQNDEIRWVSIGIRCRTDGFLGSPADWKIDYAPTTHLRGAV